MELNHFLYVETDNNIASANEATASRNSRSRNQGNSSVFKVYLCCHKD